MFRAIALGAFVLMLRVFSVFVPEQEYRAKVDGIAPMTEKNGGMDLNGWSYEQVGSSDGSFNHHFYHHPAKTDSAPVFLFIHGLNLDGRTFLNLNGLSSDYELIAYDMPEQCPWYKGDYDDYIRVISDFLEIRDIKRLSLMGVSFGGGIALGLAAQRPELKIRNLILASTAISEQSEVQTEMTQWLSEQPDYIIYWFVEQLYRRSADNYESSSSEPSVKKLLRIKHPSYYRQISASLGEHNAVHDAADLNRMPVLLLMGDQDRLFSVESAQKTIDYLDNGTLEVIKGGTHSMVYTKAAVIEQKIRDFIDAGNRQHVSKGNAKAVDTF
ncbi:MAG: alpha/beta fold hydrolase [Chitinispirillaceae bacterium]